MLSLALLPPEPHTDASSSRPSENDVACVGVRSTALSCSKPLAPAKVKEGVSAAEVSREGKEKDDVAA